MKPHKIFQIFEDRRRIYTKSLVPGKTPFGERVVKGEFREFDPHRSKLAAAIMKNCTNTGIREGDVVLYLGVSHGYTASFVSDIIGKRGLLFGIDPAPRVMRDFVFLCEERKNLVPILADANHTDEYVNRVCQADVVFQDIAQRNQAEIFIKNCDLFLKKGGWGLLAVKARSIDVTRKPKQIFVEIRRELEKKFTVIDFRVLEPYEKDHCMIIVKK
jgi:fibrillarin-like pre-rRNA processing protein